MVLLIHAFGTILRSFGLLPQEAPVMIAENRKLFFSFHNPEELCCSQSCRRCISLKERCALYMHITMASSADSNTTCSQALDQLKAAC